LTILRLIELTHVNSHWLLTGRGDKYTGECEAGGFGGRGYVGER
jgi:hypothetical protein